jgi:Domain of unknown function (DUF4037)
MSVPLDSEARSRELAKAYIDRPGTIGVMRIGSSLRPWADAQSDVDVMVVVEDEVYAKLSTRERHLFGIDRGPPRRKAYDVIVRSWREMSGYVDSPWDLNHYNYQFVRVLFDPSGRLQELLARIVRMPEETRRLRLLVHYHEVIWYRAKAEKCVQRGNLANAQLVLSLSLYALSRLLFVAQGSWASLQDWTSQELRHVGVPEDIVAALERALVAPSPEQLTQVLALVDPWFDGKGLSFHRSPIEVGDWAVYEDEGIAASRTWCAFNW